MFESRIMISLKKERYDDVYQKFPVKLKQFNKLSLKALWYSEVEKQYRQRNETLCDEVSQEETFARYFRKIIMSYVKSDNHILVYGLDGTELIQKLTHIVRSINVDPHQISTYEMIINNCESINVSEVTQKLMPDGAYINYQLSESSYYELVKFILGNIDSSDLEQMLLNETMWLKEVGLTVLETKTSKVKHTYNTIEAVMSIIIRNPTLFPGFSIEKHLDALWEIYLQIMQGKPMISEEHHYLVIAKKEI